MLPYEPSFGIFLSHVRSFLVSIGNSITTTAFPQLISLSIYPVNTMIRAVVLLLQRNKWSNIASITDSNTISREPFHHALIDGFAKVFAQNGSSQGIHYNAFQCNASADRAQIVGTLQTASQTCRSKYLFGYVRLVHLA